MYISLVDAVRVDFEQFEEGLVIESLGDLKLDPNNSSGLTIKRVKYSPEDDSNEALQEENKLYAVSVDRDSFPSKLDYIEDPNTWDKKVYKKYSFSMKKEVNFNSFSDTEPVFMNLYHSNDSGWELYINSADFSYCVLKLSSYELSSIDKYQDLILQ